MVVLGDNAKPSFRGQKTSEISSCRASTDSVQSHTSLGCMGLVYWSDFYAILHYLYHSVLQLLLHLGLLNGISCQTPGL